jgi:hypothetical protein
LEDNDGQSKKRRNNKNEGRSCGGALLRDSSIIPLTSKGQQQKTIDKNNNTDRMRKLDRVDG